MKKEGKKMNRSELILDLLTIAEEFSLRDEFSTRSIKEFIQKYSNAEVISNPIADVIKIRFKSILENAMQYLRAYNNEIDLIYS